MFRSRDLRVYPYFDKEEYEVNNQKSTLTQVWRPADYTSDESEEVHPSIKSLTAAEMIPIIQWPPRRVTANINNSYEYREMSLNPPKEIYRIRSTETIPYRRLQSITNWRRRCNYDHSIP